MAERKATEGDTALSIVIRKTGRIKGYTRVLQGCSLTVDRSERLADRCPQPQRRSHTRTQYMGIVPGPDGLKLESFY